ncbi:hypothetical protein MTR_3g464740 [Medicago truncatula]|uniref:Uncharacterized protein n=1 Tax=Medicago truncatula TaxID=3880 RepID=A0A072UWX7_MEDTR|nr:hypothetical protein MTR_3g464740 [Medicago truncatula]
MSTMNPNDVNFAPPNNILPIHWRLLLENAAEDIKDENQNEPKLQGQFAYLSLIFLR